MAPRWAAFLLLTAAVVTLVVLLARRSAAALRPATGTTSPDEVPLSGATLLANVAATHGAIVAVVSLGAWYFRIPPTALGLAGATWPAVASGVGLGLGLWVGTEAATRVGHAAGLAYDEHLRRLLAPTSPIGWLALLGVALPLVAVSEELLFRGAVIGATAAGFGASPWVLAGVSATLFGLGHGAQGRLGIAVAAVMGLAMALAYVLTGSLLVVILGHYVVNAMEFVVHEGLTG